MIKVGIVEDNEKTRERLKERLKIAEDIEIVLIAANGETVLEQLERLSGEERPDVILMDIVLPGMNGIETTILVKENYPDLQVVMQTVFEDEDRIFNSIRAGASGYLLKDIPLDDYIDAIHHIHDGGAPITPSIAGKLLDHMRTDGKKNEDSPDPMEFNLTDREFEILELIVEDLTDHGIADELHISPHTVRTHIKNIYKKLHVHSRASAVRFALRNNLFS